MRNLFNDVNENVYSVIGQNGAKNLIPYPYYEKTNTADGITWTDNGDGTVTANGTATQTTYFTLTRRTGDTNMADSLIEGERYVLTGCPTGGSNKKYDIFINETYNGSEVGMAFDYGNGATFTLNHKTETNYGLGLRIRSGQTVSNLTFKPMLRLASDSDNTYQPYAKTNKQLTESKAELESVRDYVNELGVKNLIPYPYYEKTHTENGVTFTDNEDGTITANGTATDTAIFSVVLGNTALSANGNLTINTNKPLILSGCPSGGGNNTYRIQYGLTDGTTYWAKTASDTGSGVKLTPVDGLNSYCFDVIRVMVFEGYTANNLTFKPMLRLASDINDDTYVPYAKTNRQLTESSVNKKTTVDSYYGTCSTAAATAAKVITVVDTENNFSLRPGVLVTVKFDNVNTANNPTFNVNNTGAKSVSYNNTIVSTDSLWAGGDSAPSLYVYDGTNWVLLAYSSYSTAQSVIVNPSSAPTDEGSIWIETT